ncbi:hypothetical protein PRK78_006080 [Emydomyces testavorans]|uniref:Mtf2-like C-terminal domain-containing protein n=1 Tax=Emydomyces testavorans TaxID=2070801 RepID=A0AAF0DLW0_9EURO|nr:hypothetical protein PRK78_006080 [Emydomyces testavorans]
MRRAIPSSFVTASSDSFFLPFLYCTRTITAPFPNARPNPPFRTAVPRRLCPYSTSRESPSDGSSTGDSIREESGAPSTRSHGNETEDPPNYLKQQALKFTQRRLTGRAPRSTLTAAEREIFSRLADRPNGDLQTGRSSYPAQASPQKQTSSRDSNDEESAEIFSIFSSAVHNLNKETSPVVLVGKADQEKTGKVDQPEAAVAAPSNGREITPESAHMSKVYSKLRAFRDSPIDASSPESEQLAGIDPFPLAKLIAKRESKKICKELDDAVSEGKGDVGVWQICEKRIFGMLGLFKLENVTSPELKDKGKQGGRRGRRRKTTHTPFNDTSDVKDTPKVPRGGESPLDIPDHVPVVSVVSKVYPSTLLHAARLLHKTFPMSQYSAQLLDTVKAHGRVSFVMGASVDLCNELIAFRWRVYSDLPYIVSLLEEMEEAGIEFNWETLEIVDEIRKQRQLDKEKLGMQDGSTDNGIWWWESEATRKSYKDLIGWGRGKVGWITRIRDQLRKAQKRNMQLEALSKQIP